MKGKIKKLLSDFKTFAMKGSVIDLAVGIIIGSAFTSIVNSLVNDILMPVLSMVTDGIKYEALTIPLYNGQSINYGNFISAVISFLMIAVVVFFLVRAFNSARSRFEPAPAPPVPPRKCPYCLMEIAKEATRCPHCTSELPGAEADA